MACMDDICLVSSNVEKLKETVLALKDGLEKLNLKLTSTSVEQPDKFRVR